MMKHKKGKVCPIMTKEELTNCIESRCAWWDDEFELCTIILEGFLAGLKIIKEER